MSQGLENAPLAQRTVLPDELGLWNAMKVEACRSLLSAWIGSKVPSKMKKAHATDGLVENAFSVDFARIYGWRSQGVVNPSPMPVDGVGAREWAADRTFFLLMNGGVISEQGLLGVQGLELDQFTHNTGDVPGASSLEMEVPGSMAPSTDSLGADPVPTMATSTSPAQPPPKPNSTSSAQDADTAPTTGSSSNGLCADTVAASTSSSTTLSPSQSGDAPSAPPSAPNAISSGPASSASGAGMTGDLEVAPGPALAPIPTSAVSAPDTLPAAPVLPPNASAVPGLPAIVPSNGLAEDPFWALLANALRQYAFRTLQATIPDSDARGLPLARAGSLSATGRIALFGVDRRPTTHRTQTGPVLFVLENVHLSYLPGTAMVTALSTDLMEALHREAGLQAGKL